MGEVSGREQEGGGGESKNWHFPENSLSTCSEWKEKKAREGQRERERLVLCHIETIFYLLFILTRFLLTIPLTEGLCQSTAKTKTAGEASHHPRKETGGFLSPTWQYHGLVGSAPHTVMAPLQEGEGRCLLWSGSPSPLLPPNGMLRGSRAGFQVLCQNCTRETYPSGLLFQGKQLCSASASEALLGNWVLLEAGSGITNVYLSFAIRIFINPKVTFAFHFFISLISHFVQRDLGRKFQALIH